MGTETTFVTTPGGVTPGSPLPLPRQKTRPSGEKLSGGPPRTKKKKKGASRERRNVFTGKFFTRISGGTSRSGSPVGKETGIEIRKKTLRGPYSQSPPHPSLPPFPKKNKHERGRSWKRWVKGGGHLRRPKGESPERGGN